VWPPTSSNNNTGATSGPSNGIYQHQPSIDIDQHSVNNQNNTMNNNFHLIAIARIQMTSAPNDLVNSTNAEFITRQDQNGLVTFVDQRIVGLLGYQPSDLLKKSIFDFLIPQDQQLFKEQLKTSNLKVFIFTN
jgi:aryl hydrocarbon receptor nuclear translocator